MKIKRLMLPLLMTGLLAACAITDKTPNSASMEQACMASPDWKWLPDYQECEFMDKPACEKAGGQFNECASACRHTPDAMVCVLSCIPVCSFK